VNVVSAEASHSPRHCERSEAIQTAAAGEVWIASSHPRKIATQFCLPAMMALARR
jgi:hypothetical protein